LAALVPLFLVPSSLLIHGVIAAKLTSQRESFASIAVVTRRTGPN
jgi:hypothetical protein